MKSVRGTIRFVLSMAVMISMLLSILPVNSSHAAPPIPKINWSPCYREFGFPFECGIVQVPLDYNDPTTATISIAVVRLPASDPANRIGSIFFNPGGPGGSGVEFLLYAGPYMYTEDVRAHFDLVGFDPRGIARSTALRCFGNPKQWAGYYTPFMFPITLEEEVQWQAADRYVDNACAQRGSRIIDYMSTANTARDLDMLRQAVGDQMLTFAGYSYGSYLGVTYANLFPDKIRAMVIDGVIDPIAWSTGDPGEGDTIPFTTRIHSDMGAMATLNEFFRLCDENPTVCAFSGGAADRFATLAASLRLAPIQVILPDGSLFFFNYQSLISTTLGAMYNPFSWPELAQFLAEVEFLAPPQQLGKLLYAFWEDAGFITKRGFPNYPNNIEGFPGVGCADSDNPDDYLTWWNVALETDEYSYFGPHWTYASAICAEWPGGQNGRYTGPFNAVTSNPVLVVGNFFDPATRYEGAQLVADLLPNSRLVSLDGWGHVSIFLSYCMDQIVGEYLLNGSLPAEGTVCDQDLTPFVDFGVSASQSSTALLRANFVPVVAPEALQRGITRGK